MSTYENFLKTLTILYVDNSANIEHNKEFFKTHFQRLLFHNDGLDALNTFKKDYEHIDLVVTDIKLASLNGFDLILELKEIKKKIPTFIFTSDKSPNNVMTGLKLRVSSYIFKPLNIMDMISRIHEVCYVAYEEKLILHQKKQLEDYLEVIDNVAIISKTDLKGTITFVNDIFCEVAKYEREELIGQPHNVLRHPDMPKEAFADMWGTLKEEKTWKGKVKNKAKDGSSYNVNATISPIYGDDEISVTGYMAIRFLTTDEDEKQREFKSQVMKNMKDRRLKENDYKAEIKELQDKISLGNNHEYLLESFEAEKQRVKKLNKQIEFYEGEIHNAKQKALDVATSFKEELIKSLKMTKALQLKQKSLESNLEVLKKGTKDIASQSKKFSEENKALKNRILELEDVIAFQDSNK